MFTYFPFQALLFILVRPFSKSVYRKINRVVTEMLWLEVIWLSDWWANIKVFIYLFKHLHSILISVTYLKEQHSIFIKTASQCTSSYWILAYSLWLSLSGSLNVIAKSFTWALPFSQCFRGSQALPFILSLGFHLWTNNDSVI